MDPAPTQYVDRDGSALAYQVFGNGPADLVHFYEVFQHLDLMLTDPDMNHNVERMARYSRAAYLQRRGFGLSDQVAYVPTIEQQADDIVAVMDTVGMHRATLVGWFASCGPVALVAARYPDRVHALSLISPSAQGPESGTDLHGWTDEAAQEFARNLRHAAARWGSGSTLEALAPTLDTAFNRRLMAMLERSSATPAAIHAHMEWTLQLDIQDVLRVIQAPTRVVCLPDFAVPEEAVRYVANLIPNSTFQVVRAAPGTSIGRLVLPLTDDLEETVTGSAHSTDTDRFLGSVLFTDIVASTELLERIGDSAYRQMRADHERAVRLAVETSGGRLMTVTGDGTLSVFGSPTRAVRCAEKICREAAEDIGINVRAGIHTGEIEHDAMNVTGLTVHIGARVGAAAEPGEVLVSRTVRDLLAGSGVTFTGRGEHHLKGVSGTWELFAVTHAGEQPEALPNEESMQTPMDKMVLQAARRTPGLARAAVRLGNALERRRAKARRP